MIQCASVRGTDKVKWFDEAADAYGSNGPGGGNSILDLNLSAAR